MLLLNRYQAKLEPYLCVQCMKRLCLKCHSQKAVACIKLLLQVAWLWQGNMANPVWLSVAPEYSSDITPHRSWPPRLRGNAPGLSSVGLVEEPHTEGSKLHQAGGPKSWTLVCLMNHEHSSPSQQLVLCAPFLQQMKIEKLPCSSLPEDAKSYHLISSLLWSSVLKTQEAVLWVFWLGCPRSVRFLQG